MQRIKNTIVIADEKFLCTEEGEIILFSDTEIIQLALNVIAQHYIKNHLGQDRVVAAVIQQQVPRFQWLGLRHFVHLLPEPEFQSAGRALQILRWHFDHQFCGRCGARTHQHLRDLAKSCLNCKMDFYPRLSPCIITLITRGDECLLAWHKRTQEERYSCLAGFIEIGESSEQTLVREVQEEVGLIVNNIRYVASQPWPFPGQLMLGYFADFVAGDIVIDQEELRVARWYRYNQLPNVPPKTTISGLLIDIFVQQRYLANSTRVS